MPRTQKQEKAIFFFECYARAVVGGPHAQQSNAAKLEAHGPSERQDASPDFVGRDCYQALGTSTLVDLQNFLTNLCDRFELSHLLTWLADPAGRLVRHKSVSLASRALGVS